MHKNWLVLTTNLAELNPKQKPLDLSSTTFCHIRSTWKLLGFFPLGGVPLLILFFALKTKRKNLNIEDRQTMTFGFFFAPKICMKWSEIGQRLNCPLCCHSGLVFSAKMDSFCVKDWGRQFLYVLMVSQGIHNFRNLRHPFSCPINSHLNF